MKRVQSAAMILLTMAAPAVAQSAAAVYAQALHHALAHSNAVAVVVDVRSGRVLAAQQPERAASLLTSPGSVLKPFYLETALEAGLVQPSTTVHCSRVLHIAGHTLNCGHPPEPDALDASEALAYSCNTYFAALALRMNALQIDGVLRRYGIGDAPHLLRGEAVVPVHAPQGDARRQLFVLGVAGLRVSVAQVAEAYRKLALAHLDHQEPPADATVWQGMEDSVRFGSSDNAAIAELDTAGKTGTAADPDFSRTHGWFAGIAPAAAPRIVVVIYLPSGNGGNSAGLARRFYQEALPALRGDTAR